MALKNRGGLDIFSGVLNTRIVWGDYLVHLNKSMDILIVILIVVTGVFIVYTIATLLFPKPPKSQNDDEPLVSPIKTQVETKEHEIPKMVEYDDDAVTVKRVDYIAEKLFEAGVETRNLANKFVFFIISVFLISCLIKMFLELKYKDLELSISNRVQLQQKINDAEDLGELLRIFWFIYIIVWSILILKNLYFIGTILKETKKYFKFNPDKISSRSKDPYFNK